MILAHPLVLFCSEKKKHDYVSALTMEILTIRQLLMCDKTSYQPRKIISNFSASAHDMWANMLVNLVTFMMHAKIQVKYFLD